VVILLSSRYVLLLALVGLVTAFIWVERRTNS
jgi:hypothetical protein